MTIRLTTYQKRVLDRTGPSRWLRHPRTTAARLVEDRARTIGEVAAAVKAREQRRLDTPVNVLRALMPGSGHELPVTPLAVAQASGVNRNCDGQRRS